MPYEKHGFDEGRELMPSKESRRRWNAIKNGAHIWIMYQDVYYRPKIIVGRAMRNAHSYRHHCRIEEICISVDNQGYLNVIPFEFVFAIETRD